MFMPSEETYTVVKAYFASSRTTLVVVIPKEAREKLGIGKGDKFLVKSDERGRLIYEPIR